jgi:hypothetical protein
MKRLIKGMWILVLAVVPLAAQKPEGGNAGNNGAAQGSYGRSQDRGPGQAVAANSVGAPKVVVDPQPGTYKYKGTVAAGGQEFPVSLSSTIENRSDGDWTATVVAETGNGQVSDTAVLEKGTLALRKREVKQGPAIVSVNFAGNKATGTFNMSGHGDEKTFTADLGGPVFAETAGQLVIACLPLKEGYSATFRNFDLGHQKEKLLQLKVVGVESVTVPAGTFSAYKVEVTPADGGADHQTIWIATDSRKAVKMSLVAAEMGGAKVTAELVP